MRVLLILSLSILLFGATIFSAPNRAYSKSTDIVNEVTAMVKEHPGKTAGAVGCGVVVAFFPPAAIWCAVSIAGGVTVDEVQY